MALAALIPTASFADDTTIEMLNKDANGNKMVYSKEIAKIDVGGTVKWLPTSKGHNVEIIESPNNMKFKSKNNQEVKITFDTPGIYYYWCIHYNIMDLLLTIMVRF